MADPVTEDAKYVVVVQRGRPKLLLSQRGWLEEPGPVRVICDRRSTRDSEDPLGRLDQPGDMSCVSRRKEKRPRDATQRRILDRARDVVNMP